jgi:hypothetical protein
MDEAAAIVHTVPAEPSENSDLASSFELFVEAESARFHGALRLLTRDRAEAEDLMQDAFLKVWERWGHVRALDDPTGYLYRTAMNLYRKRWRRAAVVLRHTIRPRPARDHLDEVESSDMVLRALATEPRRGPLPPRCARLGLAMDRLDQGRDRGAQRLVGQSRRLGVPLPAGIHGHCSVPRAPARLYAVRREGGIMTGGMARDGALERNRLADLYVAHAPTASGSPSC